MLRGLCRGMPPELFVPPYDPDQRVPPDPLAFATCWGSKGHKPCPVRKECLHYGRLHKCSGCWGGVALHLGRRRRD